MNDGEYRADDPAATGTVPPGSLVVTPTTAGDLTWEDMARENPGLAEFAVERWLGPWRRLGALPDGYAETVRDLNQVAFRALAPARYTATGKVGLRFTLGGFGTPFFADDRQIRIEGGFLVVQEQGRTRGRPLTTLRDAAESLGIEYRAVWGPSWHDPPAPADPDSPLRVDPAAAAALADVFGFASSTLEQIRSEAETSESPSRVQLWPEHFDMAVEIGEEHRGRRAAFGVSPGYAAHPDPFVYVSPWVKQGLTDRFWNAAHFGGAIMSHAELIEADDQRQAALGFLRQGLGLLRSR